MSSILQLMVPYAVMIASVAAIIWGDGILETGANKGASFLTSWYVIAGSLLYATGGPAWMYVMAQGVSLTRIAILYGMLTVVGVTLLGVLYFGEKFGGAQLAALVLALGAIFVSEYYT